MIQGIYQGAASMNALEKWQAAISENLAASSSAGFKKVDTTFSGIRGGATKKGSDDFGSTLASTMPQANNKLNLSQGAVSQTDKSTDLAIQGKGFFQIKGPTGAKGYTRNGEFHLDATGKLVTNQGNQVVGESGPITADPTLGPISIDRGGIVSQGGAPVGKLSLYDVDANGGWDQASNGMLVPKDGSKTTAVAKPEMLQGYVEQSNVAPLEEMVNLISVSRAYETSQKLITTLDQSTHSAIDVLGTP